jgi:membrane associated rhomboid family serine protease
MWMAYPLRFQDDPAPPRASAERLFGALVLIGALAGYGAFIAGWIFTKRRLGLTGVGAPPRAVLSHQAYLNRRSLRALLAFDFLVIFPVAVSGGIAAGIAAVYGSSDTALLIFLSGGLGPSLFFGLPIIYLVRKLREDDRRREAGERPQSSAEALAAARSVGHVGLDTLLAGPARITMAAILVISATSVVAWLLPADALGRHLLKVNAAVYRGEVWRLLTVALVHANGAHLLMNMLVLNQVARPLERLVGGWALLSVLTGGTLAGSMASVAFIPRPSVGASGGVFAVAAALVAFGWRHRAALPDGARRKIVSATAQTLAINLLLTFALPFIDWAAHLGGLLAGAAIGWWLPGSPALRAALASPARLPEPPPPRLPPTLPPPQ